MARFHVRCRHCEARRVLKQHPSLYMIVPQCRMCGRRNFRVDQWMMKRNTRLMGCDCPGYWFTHRQASKYCWLRADGSMRAIDDPDFADRTLEELV